MKTTTKKAPLRKTLGKKRKAAAGKELVHVEGDKAFWVNFGPILHSLDELSKALHDMDDNTFRHHVTADRNDFARWVEEVMNESGLAKKLQSCDSKTCCAAAVGKHVRVHF